MEKKAKSSALHIPVIIALLFGWYFGSLYFDVDRSADYTGIVEEGLGLDFEVADERVVLTPEAGSLAESVGLQGGDLLSSHGSVGAFSQDVYQHSGNPFAFEVMRDGSPVVILIPYLPEF